MSVGRRRAAATPEAARQTGIMLFFCLTGMAQVVNRAGVMAKWDTSRSHHHFTKKKKVSSSLNLPGRIEEEIKWWPCSNVKRQQETWLHTMLARQTMALPRKKNIKHEEESKDKGGVMLMNIYKSFICLLALFPQQYQLRLTDMQQMTAKNRSKQFLSRKLTWRNSSPS